MKYFFSTLLLLSISMIAVAQTNVQARTEMADLMRSNGKIYVVIAVLITILAGLFFYLMRLDRKITGLEKDIKTSAINLIQE